MTADNNANDRKMTPLWVITIFLTFTEGVLGVAATQITGGIQIALIAFVIVFPLLVAAGFFSLLWYKPHHFYAPTDFGRNLNARDFVEAMTQQKSFDESKMYETIIEAVNSTVLSEQVVSALSEKVSDEANEKVKEGLTKILEDAVDETIERIRETSFLTIDSTPLLGEKGRVWQVPYDEYATISDLQTAIWYTHGDDIPPFTYQKVWLLRDSTTGKVFFDIGRIWAERNGLKTDPRSLKAVGILPGMKLELIKATTSS